MDKLIVVGDLVRIDKRPDYDVWLVNGRDTYWTDDMTSTIGVITNVLEVSDVNNVRLNTDGILGFNAYYQIESVEVLQLGEVIDALYDTRADRIALDKKSEALKKEEARLGDYLIKKLGDSGLASARGVKATFTPKTKEVPNVTCWDKVYDFILENEALHLVQKRISESAWKELREADGVLVPGTEVFEKSTYSLTKAGAK